MTPRKLAAAALLLTLSGAAAAAPSDGVVRIGVLSDMSGLYASATGEGSVAAARLAAEDFDGRAAGAPVEVVGGDCLNRPDVGATLARRWFDEQRVDAVADGCNSAVALAVQAMAREKGRIALWSSPGSSALTGRACSPNGAQWTYDTRALANALARSVLAERRRRWFFITTDYALANALEADAAAVVRASSGEVAGPVRRPLGTTDFSAFLLQARASDADAIALADATTDTTNAIRQAREFGLDEGGRQRLVALLMLVSDVQAIGLPAAQGLLLAESYYCDRDDASRAFAARFEARTGRKPTMMQAGVYSAVQHHLRAVEAEGGDGAGPVMARMRATTVENAVTRGGRLRPDGRMVADLLVLRAKAPGESRGPWDLLRVVRVVPGGKPTGRWPRAAVRWWRRRGEWAERFWSYGTPPGVV